MPEDGTGGLEVGPAGAAGLVDDEVGAEDEDTEELLLGLGSVRLMSVVGVDDDGDDEATAGAEVEMVRMLADDAEEAEELGTDAVEEEPAVGSPAF